jgi:hypothetical protein
VRTRRTAQSIDLRQTKPPLLSTVLTPNRVPAVGCQRSLSCSAGPVVRCDQNGLGACEDTSRREGSCLRPPRPATSRVLCLGDSKFLRAEHNSGDFCSAQTLSDVKRWDVMSWRILGFFAQRPRLRLRLPHSLGALTRSCQKLWGWKHASPDSILSWLKRGCDWCQQRLHRTPAPMLDQPKLFATLHRLTRVKLFIATDRRWQRPAQPSLPEIGLRPGDRRYGSSSHNEPRQ